MTKKKKKRLTLKDLKNYKWDTSKFIMLKSSVSRCPMCANLRITKPGVQASEYSEVKND